MSTNGSSTQQEAHEQHRTPQAAPAEVNTGSNANEDIAGDEVGWYFVEQYYTTLSKSPEKLHLFYNKKSQFVAGEEAEVSNISVGRAAIQEKIASLGYEDCKVRVTNVDSQTSFDNIVIQVIGETSNKGAEPKKFVQTFVLAKQPTGYFVLNDIFRYIEEESEEVDASLEEPITAANQAEDVEMPKQTEQAAPLDTDVVDKKLETIEAEPVEETEVPSTNGNGVTPAEVEVEEAPVAEAQPEEEVTPEAAEKAVEEEIKEPEKPADPAPTPAVTRQPSQVKPAAPAQPAAPPKPLTWASRAAAAAGPLKAVVPIVTPKTATPPAQARAAPPATPSKAPASSTPAAPASAEKNTKENEPPLTPGGWQSVGNDHAKRQNRPQSVSGPQEKEGTMGYVRNVSEKVSEQALRETLAAFGELVYFDINRSKNCAFVEFAQREGYQAAIAANPHKLGGEEIHVEPRRPKSNAYGGNGYAGPRGGMNQRGRGNFEQGRPGSQGGRGNFGQNNRGRGGAPRGGRGASQTANA